jgi:hypothetical protein
VNLKDHIEDRSPHQVSLQSGRLLPSGREVLIEYHQFEDDEFTSQTQPQVICQLLSIAEDRAFCSLKCLHWFEECFDYSRCGLIFDIPHNLTGPSVSLKSIITSNTERPSLAERLHIARKIGEAVDLWHRGGWAHQNIGSHTIAFLRDEKTRSLDFSQPFLTDFFCCQPFKPPNGHKEYPKPRERPHTILELLDADFRMNDLFAFGLLLFEIGLWTTTDQIFPDQDCTLNSFKKDVKQQGKKLGFAMGTRYQRAAELCLERYRLSIDEDDGDKNHWSAQEAFKLVTANLPRNLALDE